MNNEVESLKAIINSKVFSTLSEVAQKDLLGKLTSLAFGDVEGKLKEEIFPLLKESRIEKDIVLHHKENGEWTILVAAEN